MYQGCSCMQVLNILKVKLRLLILQKVLQVKMDYNHSYDQFYFVNNGQIMDMFICKICQSVSKDPYETQCCRNTFCKSCIDTAKKRITSCPLCRRQPYQIMQAVQISRQIQILLVYCKNRNQGCTWIGALETKNMHLRECLFEKVPCEYHIVGCNAVVTHNFQMQHNINEMKTHFSMVVKCVEEKLKLSNSTKQQLKNSNQKLQDIQQELNESNREVKLYKNFYEEDKINAIINELEDTKKELEDTKKRIRRYRVKLADSNKTVDKLTYYIVIFFFVVVLIFSLMIKRCFA